MTNPPFLVGGKNTIFTESNIKQEEVSSAILNSNIGPSSNYDIMRHNAEKLSDSDPIRFLKSVGDICLWIIKHPIKTLVIGLGALVYGVSMLTCALIGLAIWSPSFLIGGATYLVERARLRAMRMRKIQQQMLGSALGCAP